jgi:hypothetical protein
VGSTTGTTAGGDDLIPAAAQLGKQLALPLAESGLALHFENDVDADAGGGFERHIDIDEAQAEASGEAPPDGRLARAHRADQDQIGSRIHAAMLTARCEAASIGVPRPSSRAGVARDAAFFRLVHAAAAGLVQPAHHQCRA